MLLPAGYDIAMAETALIATKNSGIQLAIEWYELINLACKCSVKQVEEGSTMYNRQSEKKAISEFLKTKYIFLNSFSLTP